MREFRKISVSQETCYIDFVNFFVLIHQFRVEKGGPEMEELEQQFIGGFRVVPILYTPSAETVTALRTIIPLMCVKKSTLM